MNNELQDVHSNFEWDKIQDELYEIFKNCDDECESGNYHGMVGLAEKIFIPLQKYVKVEDYVKVAEIISKKIIDSI